MSTINLNFLIDNIEVIKANYTRLLSPFFDRRTVVRFKKFIYSFDAAEWKKDKVWEAINDDIEIKVFKEIAKKFEK